MDTKINNSLGPTVYIVTCYEMRDGVVEYNEVYVYANECRAREHYDSIVEEIKSLTPQAWQVDKAKDYYCAWEDGYFAHNRTEIDIRKTNLL